MKQFILSANIATLVFIGANFYLAGILGDFRFAYGSLVGIPIVVYTTIKTLKANK